MHNPKEVIKNKLKNEFKYLRESTNTKIKDRVHYLWPLLKALNEKGKKRRLGACVMVSEDHQLINSHILNIIEEVHTHRTYIGQHVTINVWWSLTNYKIGWKMVEKPETHGMI